MRHGGWIVLLATVGCVSSDTVDCGDGHVCPARLVCASTTIDGPLCVERERLVDCEGEPDGAACGDGTERCYEGVCLAGGCGNRHLDAADGELCDDGNNAAGDGCAPDCSSDERCGNGIVDRGEQCDDSDEIAADGCSSTCDIETAQLTGAFDPLQFRFRAAGVAQDTARNRLVVFDSDGLREWDGGGWLLRSPPVTPRARISAGMVFDSRRVRSVLFGGASPTALTPLADTWVWNGVVWQAVDPIDAPDGRRDHQMAYDPVRDRIVLFGGNTSVNGFAPADDTWEFDGTNWHLVQVATVPPARFSGGMVFDPKRNVIVMAGGFTHSNVPLADTWEYDGTTWTQRASMPGTLTEFAMVFDPTRQQILATGGRKTFAVTATDVVWSYDGTAWTTLPFTLATPRRLHAHFVTPQGRVQTVYGVGDTILRTSVEEILANDTREFVPGFPAPVIERAVANVPGGFLVFGGLDNTDTAIQDTILYTGAEWRTLTPAMAPSARHGHAMAYDAARRRVVLFGGADGGNTTLHADTWLWDGTTWTQQTPATAPSGRKWHAMTYDAKREVVLLHGGVTNVGSGTTSSETWAWNGVTWTRVAMNDPSPRALATMQYDPIREEVVLFGGRELNSSGPYQDTWVWNGTAWINPTTVETPPARQSAAVAWNPARGRVTLFAGQTGTGELNDFWEWTGARWTEVAVGNPYQPMSFAVGASVADGVAFLGGINNVGTKLGGIEVLRWGGQRPAEECREPAVDVDGDNRVGCADPDCWSMCTPVCPPLASCVTMSTPRCGDGTCDPYETCRSCASDCGVCAVLCGDAVCTSEQTSCPGDCY